METKKIFTWENDDIATREKLDPLFDDLGLGRMDHRRSEEPEQKELARVAARHYFTDMIMQKDEYMKMGLLNVMAITFYDGFLAGLTKTAYPKAY